MEYSKELTSYDGVCVDDLVVRMDGGPSGLYRVCKIHDDGVINIRLNTESGLLCHGSWVYYRYVRKATESEIKSNWREGERYWPRVDELCGFIKDELVVLKEGDDNRIFYVTSLVKTERSYNDMHDKGMVELKEATIRSSEPVWVKIEEIRKPTNTELRIQERNK